jgi:ketosteroid isomerase-like protein
MKSRIWIALSLAIAVFGANAQGPSTAQTIQKLEDEFLGALGRRDMAAMEKFYASDYTFITDEGELLTRQQRLDGVKNSRFQQTGHSYDQFSLRQYGDTAVVTAHYSARGYLKPAANEPQIQPAAAKESSYHGRFTQVWVKQDRWRMVMGHFSQIPPPPEEARK